MSIHLSRDLESLQTRLSTMCEMVADAVHRGVESLDNPDPELIQFLIQHDDEIDQLDVEIEDSCLKILALHQPVATDLRRIAAVLKITSELERIADLGVNIAERSLALRILPKTPTPPKLENMARQAVEMLDRSITCYLKLDTVSARKICGEDDAIDALNREIISELMDLMKVRPELIETSMQLFSVSRSIERVADHATNIAEDVIYLVEGDIVRHQSELLLQKRESA